MHRIDDVLARSLLRLALDRADEYVLIAELIHHGLHLRVGDLRLVRGAVSHEHERNAVRSRSFRRFIARCADRRRNRRDRNALLVVVDFRRVRADFAEQGFRDRDGLELVRIRRDRRAKLVVFRAVHQMRRLDHEVLHAVFDRAFQRLIHVVDELAVARLHVVDDDLRGERSAHRPVGERLFERRLDAADIGRTAAVERRAEAHDQQLVLADAVRVSRIVQRRVAGVSAEVIGIGFLTLDQFLLRVRQRVPRGLRRRALRVGIRRAFLHVDRVDQRRDLVRLRLVLRSRVGRVRRVFNGFRRRLGRLFVLVAGAREREHGEHGDRQRQCQYLFHVFSSFEFSGAAAPP